MGIMVPNVQNTEEAQAVVSACRYGPEGIRGAAPILLRATNYGKDIARYQEWMENDFLLIAQIESKEAVDQIEEIAAIDGIDMLFIGPIDLSASLGQLGHFESKAFIEAFEKIERAALAAGKLLGAIPFADWNAERLYENGHHLVLSGADSILLREAAEQDVADLNNALVEADRKKLTLD